MAANLHDRGAPPASEDSGANVPGMSVVVNCTELRSWSLRAAVLLTIALLVEQLLVGRSVIDGPVWIAVAAARSERLDRVMRAITWLGRGEVLCAVVIGSAVLAWRRMEYSAVRFLIVSGLSAAVLSAVLKLLVARERPELLGRMVAAGGFSFPSGHSLGSMAVYGAVGVWLGSRGPRAWRGMVTSGAVAVAIAVGLSRIYLRVHYASDVLAGLAMGYILISKLTPRRTLDSGEGESEPLRRRRSISEGGVRGRRKCDRRSGEPSRRH